MKLEEADSLKTSLERNLILVRLEELSRALETLVEANAERKVTFTDSTGKIWERHEIGRAIERSDYSIKLSKRAREVQLLSGLVESKDLELQRSLWLVDEVSLLRELFSKLREENYELTAESIVVLAMVTESFL